MSPHRLWAILRKEFRHIWRDKRTLFLVTLSPAIMLFTFAYLFALEVQKARLAVWDMDRTALSRQLVASLTADGKFIRSGDVAGYAHIYHELQSGAIHVALVIPPDFQARLIAGERVALQAITDGSDPVTTIQTLGRLRQRLYEFSQRQGLTSASSMIAVETQAWYNRELNSKYSMVPGLLPVVLILPSLAFALALTREKELGSFETLATTPIQAAEYLLGKLLPYVAFGLLSALIAVAVAILWFHVPLRGSLFDLLIFILLYLFASLGETMFIAGFLGSQGTAMRAILLIFFIPSFFMTGIILPIDTRSGIAQLVASFLPATQFVLMTRGVFLKAMDIPALWLQATYLLALGAVPMLLSWLMFRKQVD
ncbi:MAG: ABC transporter permease [Anaerolineae bacterium]|nr:ABC transporter permease [Anaerolineae bacterium]